MGLVQREFAYDVITYSSAEANAWVKSGKGTASYFLEDTFITENVEIYRKNDIISMHNTIGCDVEKESFNMQTLDYTSGSMDIYRGNVINEMLTTLKIHELGVRDYQSTWTEMKEFTANRGPDTADEIWFLEHYPVYTQGTSCKDMPFKNSRGIPVVHSDRGGQMTYHGPGQLIIYLLMDKY